MPESVAAGIGDSRLSAATQTTRLPAISLQASRHFLPAGQHSAVTQIRQLVGVSLASQDGPDDRLCAKPADVTEYVG